VSGRARLHRAGQPGARSRDSGAVLIIVLMVMLTLLSLGVMSIWLTGGNLQISGNMNQRAQTLFCAQAGLERARAFLNTAPASAIPQFLSQHLVASGQTKDNVPTAFDAGGKPNGVGAVLVDTVGPLANVAYPPASFGRSGSGAATMGTYTVWVRNDLADIRQGSYVTDTNSTVVVRAQCVAPDGRINTTIEVTVVPPLGVSWAPLAAECLDSGKNNDDANTNTVHCSRGQ
jgi:hypothetical protein